MVHVLDTSPQGGDAGLRRIQAEITDLARELSDLRATVGRQGAIYDRTGITIQNGGNIVGEGGGHIDWQGTAHFGGETTIDGNLNLAAGIIGSNALAEQVTAEGVRVWGQNMPTSSWSTLATVEIPVPEWATRAVVFTSGQINYRINPSGPQFPEVVFELNATNAGAQPISNRGNGYGAYHSGSTSWCLTLSSNQLAVRDTIVMNLRGYSQTPTGFRTDYFNGAFINSIALYLR